MKTWLTLRYEDGTLTVQAFASEDVTDSKDAVHTVTASMPVPYPDALAEPFAKLLEGVLPALKKRLARDKARHLGVVEEAVASGKETPWHQDYAE